MLQEKSAEKPAPQSVEVSLKYMAWNFKEMSECMKSIDMVLKSIDLSLKKLTNNSSRPQSKNEELPF